MLRSVGGFSAFLAAVAIFGSSTAQAQEIIIDGCGYQGAKGEQTLDARPLGGLLCNNTPNTAGYFSTNGGGTWQNLDAGTCYVINNPAPVKVKPAPNGSINYTFAYLTRDPLPRKGCNGSPPKLAK